MPARVLFVIPDLAVGGAERHLVSLATSMDPGSCAPSVLCLGDEGAFFGELVAAGIPCAALGHRKIDALRTLVALYRCLRRDRPDAVVVRGYSAETLGRVAARLARTPAAVWVHNATDLERRSRVRRVLDRLLIPRSAAVLGLVEAQRPYLRGLGWREDQIVLVPPGVDPLPVARSRATVRAELGIDPDDEVVVSVARHSPEKDLPTTVRALAAVRTARPRVRLLLVGDGGCRSGLERLVAELGLRDTAIFTGRRDDVGDLLGASDLAVLSSVSECAPQAVLEAMEAGLPVVATAVGGVPELVADGGTGVLVPPGDPAALASAVVDLLADPARRDRFANAARLRVERHRWRVVAPQAEAALLDVCRRRATAGRLGWYVQRARAMGPREIGTRAVRAVRPVPREPSDAALFTGPAAEWATRLEAFRARPALVDAAGTATLAAEDPTGLAAVRTAADRAAERRFTFFAAAEAHYPEAIDWHHDPVGDARWPRRPARSIDHRTAAGDPKWIWELHRLQHLPWLAQAWQQTGEHRYAEEALAQLDSWIADNPVDVGIGWRGAFECGVRAISVVSALQGLAASPALTPERFARAVRMLDAAARRCWRDRSLYSSANNHLVGELAGLVVVATAFPDLAGPARLRRRALDELAREADRQILPDGAGSEQAIAYQVFTADLIAVVIATLRVARDHDPTAEVLVAALDRSADHLVALVGDDDPVLRYGDDDEGHALRLDPAPLRAVRAHLATVAALTGHPTAARAGRPDVTSRRYATRVPGGARGTGRERPGNHHAPDGGLVVLRDAGRRVTVDVGPLGHGALAAHGHADALAVTLACGGRELVGDPGTASYYGHPAWRTAARGTRAHATVTVDGVDQSVMGGPFLWSRHARVRVREVDPAAGIVDAEHDGYRRLARPVTHRRRVVARPGAPVVVVDLLLGPGPHEIRTGWPLPPDLTAVPRADGVDVLGDGSTVARLRHAATVPWTTTAVRGDEDADLGWWSTRLESREPAWLVGGVGTADGPVTVVATVLVPGDGPDPGAPTVDLQDGSVRVTWWTGDGTSSTELEP